MEISNSQDYHFIREEMKNLKNCITHYLGFVLGGSGVSFIGFYTIDNHVDKYELIAFISLILAVTISIVLFIIFYKFNSHNRYAGYCKLLNQEQLKTEDTQVSQKNYDVTSWEICMDRLRISDFEDKPFEDLLPDLVGDDIIKADKINEILELSGKNKKADEGRYLKGIKIILEILRGKVQSKSWQFPIFVVGVFISLATIYVVFSLFSMWQVHPIFKNTFSIHNIDLSIISYALLLLVFTGMWIAYFGKLANLMCGSATVDAYCWKFLPARYGFIKRKSMDIKYSLITLKENVKVDSRC